ncbi:MAG: hypothetical protein Q9204_003040 [Flavoplaca sp. TL-2023a]
MSTMAANRDERFLMRQRGAGTRDINLTFDLQLPGVPPISRSPSRPQKYVRPQPDLPSSRATRQTPKMAKATPKLIAKRTPARANNTTHSIVTGDENVERAKASKHSLNPEPLRDISQGVSAQKRKVGLSLPEGSTQDVEVPPTKRRKKRKSIGQDSLRKRTRAPPLTQQKSVHESKIITNLKKSAAVHPESTKVAAEPTSHATDMLAGSDISQNPAAVSKMAQVATEPKRRKRKSIGQIQKPRKRPKCTEQTAMHATQDDKDQQQVAVFADDMDVGEPKIAEEPKPQRHKRQAPTNLSDVFLGEPVPTQSIEEIPTAEQAKKRGRKPNPAISIAERTEVSSNLPMSVAEIHPSRGEPSSQPDGIAPKADEASTVPKQARKKRKPIGQTQRTKKKPSTRPLRANDPNLNLTGGDIVKMRSTESAIPSPTLQDVSLSENGRILPPKGDQVELDHDKKSSAPAPASKKRGRPKKAEATFQGLLMVNKPVQDEPKYEIPTSAPAIVKHGRPKKSQEAAQEHPTKLEPDYVKPNNETAMSAPAIKKRGRPKKGQAISRERQTDIEPAQSQPQNDSFAPASAIEELVRPREAQFAPQAAEIDELDNAYDEAKPAKAPKNRRVPTQKRVSTCETQPPEASQPTHTDFVLTQPRKRRAKNAIPPISQDNGSKALPKALDKSTAEQHNKVLSPAPVKKRGRPKKQATDRPVAADAVRKPPTFKLRQTKNEANDAPSDLSPAIVSKIRDRPTTALAVPDDVDDVNDDPLSECTLLIEPVKLRSRTRRQVSPNIPKKYEDPVSNQSDPSEAPVLKVTRRHPKAHAKELVSRDPDIEVVTHPLPRQSQPSSKSRFLDTSPPSHPPAKRITDLESHIEQSLLEENALKADLEELQAQRAQEIAEQKERDLNMHLEKLSTSAKGQKKQGLASIDRESQGGHHDEPLLRVKKRARGFDNLFRTVSVTGKGSGREIDPDLQGILDQVKGVTREGMKIF